MAARDAGEVDALILASSGLDRLGEAHRISERISPERLCPPLGAAIIALQCRIDDEETKKVAALLHHPATAAEVIAERTVLQGMGGFCNAPLAGYCTTDKSGLLIVRDMVFTLDGATAIDVRHSGEDPVDTAKELCRRLD
ncbi:hypothetical protein [Streptomyces atratus]|uniref:hypothetical protein n=1 Tax=Streptomyces atratus TaxID=1893 RepID=UPI002253456B|nr:hypothetical protein [Streptomyces atratus]MCX5338580.1 hypothetical protein [Streptomyces atratus]